MPAGSASEYEASYRDYARRYPQFGYGARCRQWVSASVQEPHQSFGNGSAMRVPPVGLAFDEEGTVLREAARSASFVEVIDAFEDQLRTREERGG